MPRARSCRSWRRPRARVRLIIGLARIFGTKAVAELVQALEGDEEEAYDAQGDSAEVASIAADEREHAEIWRRLERGGPAHGDGADAVPHVPVAAMPMPPGRCRRRRPSRHHRARPDGHRAGAHGASASPDQIAAREGWHRSARSGTLRAVIFGVSDGLVSNLSLVMGVAGASAASEARFILLAGIAGLLAGAFSMAAGEYISMQCQRELFERQIELERSELEAMPDEEQAELAGVYRAKGFSAGKPTDRRAPVPRPQRPWTRWCARSSGSTRTSSAHRWGAAGGSFAAFALGAAVPVIPYLLAGGRRCVRGQPPLSLVALFAVGAGSACSPAAGSLVLGCRQVAIGAAAAVVTYCRQR